MNDGGGLKGSEEPSGRLVLVTGLAGAGYSTALDTLQDMGYLAVDNLPMSLISQLVSLEVEAAGKKLAVSIDVRTSGFDASELEGLMADFRNRLGDRIAMIFLTASRDELFRRYNATRRRHPLSVNGMADDLNEAVEMDWERMAPLNPIADASIDTSETSPSEFRHALLAAIGEAKAEPLPVSVQSFSYRKGVPANADMVLDMRFLGNPHWEPGLADKTGLDGEVQKFIRDDPAFGKAIGHLEKFLALALPRFSAEGRPRFSIATGCTGGRHRSVFAAVEIAAMLEKAGHSVQLSHRDIP